MKDFKKIVVVCCRNLHIFNKWCTDKKYIERDEYSYYNDNTLYMFYRCGGFIGRHINKIIILDDEMFYLIPRFEPEDFARIVKYKAIEIQPEPKI